MTFARGRWATALTCAAFIAVTCFLPGRAALASEQPTVLVYYANETMEGSLESANYQALFNILKMNPEVGSELKSTLEFDASHFPAVVTRDIESLAELAFNGEMELFVFTNALTRRNQYLFGHSRKRSVELRPLNLEALPPDVVLENSPLSRSEVLVRALETAVGKRNAPTNLYLIVNTHGTDEFAMIPRVAANFVTASPAQVLAQLSANGQSDLSLPLVMSGSRKIAFWRAIEDVSARLPVKFPLIFVESCESAPHKWSEVLAIPSSVSLIAHSGFSGLKPMEIDFATVKASRGDTFAGHLSAELTKAGVHVDPRWLVWVWPLRVTLSQVNVWWFFLPLAIWAPVAAFMWFRARRSNPAFSTSSPLET